MQERERESGEERVVPEPRGGDLLHPDLRPHARHADGPGRVLLQGQLREQEVQGADVGRDEEQGAAGAVRGARH